MAAHILVGLYEYPCVTCLTLFECEKHNVVIAMIHKCFCHVSKAMIENKGHIEENEIGYRDIPRAYNGLKRV